VEAGKSFELIFENPDGIPHNLVIVSPGAMQEIATTAQTQAPDKLDAEGRAYVIAGDPRILAATKLVEAGKSETLHLTAPPAEGTYPYACTFPGHWMIMKGELIVTKDVQAYLSTHPKK
jgi:azurin